MIDHTTPTASGNAEHRADSAAPNGHPHAAPGWVPPPPPFGAAGRTGPIPPPPDEGPPPTSGGWKAAAEEKDRREAEAKAAEEAAKAARESARAAGGDRKAREGRKHRDAFVESLKASGYKGRKPKQVAEALGRLTHLWPDWLIRGEMSMLKSPPKHGKTRTYLSLIKAMHRDDAWPDGAPNEHVGAKALILPYDKNTLEIEEELERLGIQDAVTIPNDPEDETGSRVFDLEDERLPLTIEYLVDDDPSYKLLVVDTLTYASNLSLNKPDEMKRMLDPLMDVATRKGLSLLVLIHQNAQGGALGRRILERARILWSLERLNEGDIEHLRLKVDETNLPRRPALLVTHAEAGVEFSPAYDDGSRPAEAEDAFARWLVGYLRGRDEAPSYYDVLKAAGPERVGEADADGRPKNRRILDRAVKRINRGAPSLADLGRIRIAEDPRTLPGRTKPLTYYTVRSLDADDAVAAFARVALVPGPPTPWEEVASTYDRWASEEGRPPVAPSEVRSGVVAARPDAAGRFCRLSLVPAPTTTEAAPPTPPPAPPPDPDSPLEQARRIMAQRAAARAAAEPVAPTPEPIVEEVSEPAPEPVAPAAKLPRLIKAGLDCFPGLHPELRPDHRGGWTLRLLGVPGHVPVSIPGHLSPADQADRIDLICQMAEEAMPPAESGDRDQSF
ncbi:AAA family ATPase [Paludisphaera soli]|uniref:AAA family ATPase n=1 Tax=Paludisphaera soli TaxID=2712865 RepID=UPI0013EB3688|nr:AAA family ATPase [Paludisphaera soli]